MILNMWVNFVVCDDDMIILNYWNCCYMIGWCVVCRILGVSDCMIGECFFWKFWMLIFEFVSLFKQFVIIVFQYEDVILFKIDFCFCSYWLR